LAGESAEVQNRRSRTASGPLIGERFSSGSEAQPKSARSDSAVLVRVAKIPTKREIFPRFGMDLQHSRRLRGIRVIQKRTKRWELILNPVQAPLHTRAQDNLGNHGIHLPFQYADGILNGSYGPKPGFAARFFFSPIQRLFWSKAPERACSHYTTRPFPISSAMVCLPYPFSHGWPVAINGGPGARPRGALAGARPGSLGIIRRWMSGRRDRKAPVGP